MEKQDFPIRATIQPETDSSELTHHNMEFGNALFPNFPTETLVDGTEACRWARLDGLWS